MVILRKAKKDDCAVCYELSKTTELLNPGGEPASLWWIQAFVLENQIFFVAEDNMEIIGFILGEKTTGNTAFIHLVVVSEEYRKKGIGKMLLKKFEEECKNRRLRAIHLYGYAENKDSLEFFEKAGYKKGSLTYEFLKRANDN